MSGSLISSSALTENVYTIIFTCTLAFVVHHGLITLTGHRNPTCSLCNVAIPVSKTAFPAPSVSTLIITVTPTVTIANTPAALHVSPAANIAAPYAPTSRRSTANCIEFMHNT